MSSYQPAPTFADLIIVDSSKVPKFNPIWLQWFLDVTSSLGPGGTTNFDSVDNIIANQVFGG